MHRFGYFNLVTTGGCGGTGGLGGMLAVAELSET